MKLFCQMASFALTLLLSGCLKHGVIPPGNTIDNCHITSMTFVNGEFSLTDTLTFYYNPDGTPSRIDRAFVDDGSPKYIFRYDGQGRLLDYIGALMTRSTFTAPTTSGNSSTMTIAIITHYRSSNTMLTACLRK